MNREDLNRRIDKLDLENAQLTEQLKQNDARLERLRFLEAALETVPVGVVLADENGRIFHGNSRVEDMVRHGVLHSEDTDSYGEWVSYHADGRRVESHEYPLARVIRDGEDHAEMDVHYQRGDGSRFWMRIIGRPAFYGNGAPSGAAVALIDIDEEVILRRTQDILIAELNHRVKNAFTVMKSIVSLSLRQLDVSDETRKAIDHRLEAYADAHSRLVGAKWDRALVNEIAEGVIGRIAPDRVTMQGPVAEVPSRQALALSMAFYELTTNALKYGSLSTPEGRVDLSWDVDGLGEDRSLTISWTERGGPPITKPQGSGFGSLVTGRLLTDATGGTVTARFDPDGVDWHLTMPYK
ncbi:HWE histidine kinase domain-containing protein [Aestuariibius sp. 2305UL40-4]|uniref:HWE histidine kinase domain-containing protein n=1 Tax=Aestuariibius violaceus TaxID=3234132 RepID=UPI00345E4C1E